MDRTMKPKERIIIYALLSILLVLNGLFLLSGTGTIAQAATADAFQDDDPYHRDHSIAFVHISRLLNGLLKGETYEEERQALIEQIEEKDVEYRDQLNDLNERIQALDPDSPEGQQMQQQGAQLFQEYRAWQQRMALQRDQLAAKHLEQAYRDLIDAVNVVGERLDIDLVYRFIPTDEEFDLRSVEAVTMAIRLRPALRYPEDLDLTIEVMEELSIDED